MKTNLLYAITIITAITLAASTASAYTITNYTANSTYTVPSGVTAILVEAIGAGGGGGSAVNGATAGGGAGGSYARSIIPVTAGQNFSVAIGTGAAGTNGINTTINGTTYTITANGGAKGADCTACTNAVGGTGSTTGSIGNTTYAGGNGGNAGGTNSGGGGGSAAANGTGYNAAAQNAGAGNTFLSTLTTTLAGAAGATGRTSSGVGAAGTAPGGGGAGGYIGGGGSNAGGAGARGEARITEFTSNVTTVNFYIRDENTLAIITGTTFTVTITSNANSSIWTYTTTSGTLTVLDMLSGNYTVQVSGGSYTTRQYALSIPTTLSTMSLTAYMTTAVTQTNFIMQAINGPNAGQYVADATVTLERVLNGTFTVVESRYSDITGTAGPFTYNTTGYYRVTVTASGYSTKQFTLNPIQYSSYDVQLSATTTFNASGDYSGISLAITPTSYTVGQSSTLTFLIASPDGALINYNYTATYPTGNSSNSSNNAYGSTLTSNISIDAGASITDTLTLAWCYETADIGERCFSFEYPINPQSGNWTWKARGAADTTPPLEKTVAGIAIAGVAVGAASVAAGPLAGGAVMLIIIATLYKLAFFSIWSVLIAFVVGIIAIGIGGNQP